MKRALISTIVALAAASLLSACGARANGNNAALQTGLQDETAMANASEAGLMEYLMVLMFASSEAIDPADVNAVSLPGDDNLEP